MFKITKTTCGLFNVFPGDAWWQTGRSSGEFISGLRWQGGVFSGFKSFCRSRLIAPDKWRPHTTTSGTKYLNQYGIFNRGWKDVSVSRWVSEDWNQKKVLICDDENLNHLKYSGCWSHLTAPPWMKPRVHEINPTELTWVHFFNLRSLIQF